MRRSKEETVEVSVTIKMETAKAYLVDHGGKTEVWIPKSQIRQVGKEGNLGVMEVTEWIAKEKGLI